ncbi:carboxylate-amine ligase [Fibrisoma limi]|uniref:carboxylate-amine ligase n=1 Tax=Fibrisoma limi TaxID=663275 RepID=UPI0005868691|nr:carboxylate-amine ligase [Fibrisoma limi]
MSLSKDDFTIGVEEEYQIIHPETRELRSRGRSVLSKAQATVGDQVTQELYLSQIEIGTSVCHSLADVRGELQRLRSGIITAAKKVDCRIAAAGTHPFSNWEGQKLTPKERYQDLAADYKQLVWEQLIFGCHVHVGIPDREIAIQVMNRSRPWLASILALASNSPFWIGHDTGYSSYRTEIWGRWPTSGIPHVFASRSEYDKLVEDLIATGSISEASKIYWDMRPSSHYETLEYRVTDVCLTIDEAVMIAGLLRALARTCAQEAERYTEITHARPEVLQAAKWQAARYGLDAKLIDTQKGRPVAARTLIKALLEYVRPALEEFGDWKEINTRVRDVLTGGTGASRQREIFRKKGSLEDVVDFTTDEMARGI